MHHPFVALRGPWVGSRCEGVSGGVMDVEREARPPAVCGEREPRCPDPLSLTDGCNL